VRPVNLIPTDERRGDRAAMRTGVFSYVLLAALAAAVLGVAVLALTSKQIKDRKSEVAQLQVQEQQAQAKAQSLAAFTQFRAAQQARSDTVNSLASSRFDWQRVMNEFAKVIPSNVWFVKISGTVDPTVSVADGPDIQSRESIPGPALELQGCATSQDAVAGLIASLEDIDGVTRVGLDSSGKSDDPQDSAAAAPTTGDSSSGNTDCQTLEFIAEFKIIVAFDEVPTPATATTSPSVPPGVATSGSSQLTASSGTGG
jgi:Tfp pilus assembly protein PilN